MNIFLIGFMGSGKSSLGAKIARRMNFDFVDMDNEIEKLEKKSIPAIFEQKGETYFRQTETDWLKNLTLKNHVIATGGGAPCAPENFNLIQSKGISVYLKAKPELLIGRLMQSKSQRPLVEKYKNDPDQLLHYVKTKLIERELFYNRCDLTIDAADITATKIDLLVEEIINYRK